MLCTVPVIISVGVVGGLIAIVVIGACAYFAFKQFAASKPAAVSEVMPPTRPMSRAPLYGNQRPYNTPHFHDWV